MGALARAVHEAILSDATVTDNFTARGTHDGCGECCGRFLPLFPREAVELRIAARKLEVRPEEPGTVDLTCPLLDGSNRCMVYGKRPTVCRAYDCSRHAAEGMAFALAAADMGLEPGMRVYDMREVVG